ncbi:MAG TPA: hypothetical protein DCQ50_01590 [Chryseobacterium sp.]|nr:hypothetical protein [Chryseobacterium sp.]
MGWSCHFFCSGKHIYKTRVEGIMVSSVSMVLLVAGAVIAIIGALRIYYKWSNGDEYIEKDVMMWAGGILFLVLIQIFVKAVF